MSLWYKKINRGKPELVFIHGAGSNHTVWAPFVERFCSQSIILVDLPGHGNSQAVPYVSLEKAADDIVSIIKKENAKAVTLVGHSMGGIISAIIAKKTGNIVKGAVLLCPFAKNTVSLPKSFLAFWSLAKAISLEPSSPKPVQDYSRCHKRSTMAVSLLDLKGVHLKTYAAGVVDLLRHDFNAADLRCRAVITKGRQDFLLHNRISKSAGLQKHHQILEVDSNHLISANSIDVLCEKIQEMIE